jgi:hypothetical protein
MGINNTERELGILRAEVDHLKEDVKEVKADVKEILEVLNRDKGGKAALFKLLAAASAVGTIFGSAITIIFRFIS